MKPLLTLHSPKQADAYYREGVWRDDTFYTLLAGHAAARPDGWALRDSKRRLTWNELLNWVDAIAAHFEATGLRPGERVSLWLSNRVEVVVAFLACARQGLVCNPSLHQNYTGGEILTLLKRVRASALIVERGYGADAKRHDIIPEATALPGMRAVTVLPPGRTPGDEFPSHADILPPRRDDPDTVGYLAFTSGTTGMPKGVMHSDNTLLANARAMVADWGHDEATVLLSLSPLSHHIAWVAIAQALVAGAEFVINDPPAGLHALDWIVESGATYVMGVPTHAIDIQAEPSSGGSTDKMKSTVPSALAMSPSTSVCGVSAMFGLNVSR